MKAQNFNFMKDLVHHIVTKRKRITNRADTEYRRKLKKGSIMHLFTGLRGPHCEKIGDALILDIIYWKQEWIPCNDLKYERTPFWTPFFDLTWWGFAKMDGFDDFRTFKEYFSHERYKKGIICFVFELIENEENYR